jgi:hypothetical protein
VRALVDLLQKKYISSGSDLRPLDLARKASFFTMDVITDIAFGSTWGCLKSDEDIGGWFEGTEQVMAAALWVSSFPLLNRLLNVPFIAKMVMPSDKDATGSGRLMGFVGTFSSRVSLTTGSIIKSIMEKRAQISGHENQRDMMGSFFRHGITSSVAATEASLAV